MLPYFSQDFGNPASAQHSLGRRAAEAVEIAREQVAALVGADRREIVFCSGATEANNLALKGLGVPDTRNGLVTIATEHPAVLDTARSLERQGWDVTELPVDRDGQPALADLEAAVGERTLLVSVAAANNEIGTLPPLRAIAEIAHDRGALLHSDAAQAAGRLDIDVERDGIDFLSLSSHKLYGPKGVGALFVGREVQGRLSALVDGGGHERGLRSGTVNSPGVVGFGAAADLARAECTSEADHLRHLSARFSAALYGAVEGIELNGPSAPRLPGNLNLRFQGVDADALMANCPELCFSAGSACSALTPTPSHVLSAIGLDKDAAEQSVRFSFGRPTTIDEVDRAAHIVAAAVGRIRELMDAPAPIGAR
jgi:cysteine desulfurase